MRRRVLGLLSAVALLSVGSGYTAGAISDAAAAPRNFPLHQAPKPLPDLSFKDEQGRNVRLRDFRGKVVVLNVWATWCAPCRQEMPTLDRLQAKLGGPEFEVIALSVDHAGPQAVQKFFRQIGVKHLRLYIDSSPETMDKLNVPGLPVTFLIDRQGRELGRLVGTTEWDSPEMLRLLRSVIGKGREDRTVELPSRTLAAR